jgi:hypothetical protein
MPKPSAECAVVDPQEWRVGLNGYAVGREEGREERGHEAIFGVAWALSQT